MSKDYASVCVLSTYGVTNEEYLSIVEALKEHDVEVCYTESYQEGRLSIAKKNVDSVAITRALQVVLMIVGDKVYADEAVSLSAVAVKTLKKKGFLLSVAESITGGMLSSAICDIDGASGVFYEGLVTYNSAAKVRRLHVPAGTIEQFTAVSQEVCKAMLDGVLANKEINVAITTTGYAANMDEDTGLVYIGVGDKTNKEIFEKRFTGDRNSIRRQAVNAALFLLIKHLCAALR